MRLKKVLGVFIFLILTLGILVSADIFSINSGGGLGIFLSPGANIEGFFSASTIDVSSCGTLSDTGAVYTLTQNVSSTGTCFTVAAQNVTLNCQGHSINYSTTTVGYGLVNNGYHFVTLENCEFNLGNFGLANSYGVYVYGGALNNTIDNIKVTTTSISTAENKNNYGIYFNNVQKSIIKDSNISALSSGYTGYSNYGISLSSGSNNTLTNNVILTNNYLGHGIYVNSNQNNISGNLIHTLFTNSDGLMISGNSNYFYNNSIITDQDDAGGDSSFGIYIYSGTNNVFRNNNVITYKSPSYISKGGYASDIDTSNLAEGKPVWYNDSLSNYIFQNVNFSNYGQVVCAGCNNVTYENVTVINDGLLFGGTTNSFIKNSNITSNTSHGVYLFYSNGNLINNSYISETKDYVNALKIRYSNNNNIENSRIYETTNEYAIYMQGASYTLFYNNIIDSYGSNYGVLLYGATDYENFTKNTFNTITSCMILDSQSSTQSYFQQNDFNCGGGYSLYAYRGSNTYLSTNDDFNGNKILFGYASSAHIFNVTNASNFGGGYFSTATSNKLYVNWYLDAYVNNTFGVSLFEANVSSWNSNLNLIFSNLTGSDGWINRQLLREYFQNYTNKYYEGNYTLNTTKFGYFDDSRNLNMTRSRIEYVTLEGTPPIISIISPNATEYGTLSVDFNISVIDDENISSCLYSLDFDSNVTMNRLNDSYFWDSPNLGPGPHDLTYYCNDTSNNWGTNSTNFSIANSAAISILLSENLTIGVKWNVISLPVDDLDAMGNNLNASTSYLINISAINTLVDLYMKSDGDLVNDWSDVIGLGNETYTFNSSDSTLVGANKITMTTNYSLIGSSMGDNSVVFLKFYLDAPSSQAAGVYTNNLSIKAVRAGQAP